MTLSALFLLDKLDRYDLEEHVTELIPTNMKNYLFSIKAQDGVPQSGNLAMCMAVIAIYADKFLGLPSRGVVHDWVDFHLSHMNKFGFWGDPKVNHLQFQNGYHQYEIFEYLKVENARHAQAVSLVISLADKFGHFAPYAGGSGCYDYDAIAILSSQNKTLDHTHRLVLMRTANAILRKPNPDGGFSESKLIRPRSVASINSGIGHFLSARNFSTFNERFQVFFSSSKTKA